MIWSVDDNILLLFNVDTFPQELRNAPQIGICIEVAVVKYLYLLLDSEANM